MARRNPLAMLVGIAAVAGALAQHVAAVRLPARRRELTDAEAETLYVGRSRVAEHLAVRWPDLTNEDLARIANSWPANLRLDPVRKQ